MFWTWCSTRWPMQPSSPRRSRTGAANLKPKKRRTSLESRTKHTAFDGERDGTGKTKGSWNHDRPEERLFLGRCVRSSFRALRAHAPPCGAQRSEGRHSHRTLREKSSFECEGRI